MNSCQFPAMIEQLFIDIPVARTSMEIIFVRRCKKSKQNSDKIIHRNTALKSTFWILLCNNSDSNMFCRALTFAGGDVENLPRNPTNVNGKTCMSAMLESLAPSCHEA